MVTCFFLAREVELYGPVNKLWTSLPSLNREKGGLGAVSLDGKIFTVGGGTKQEYFSEVEMLDPNAGRWIPTRSMLHKVTLKVNFCVKLTYNCVIRTN